MIDLENQANVEVDQISDEEFEQLMGSVPPSGTPGAGNIQGTVKDKPSKEDKDKDKEDNDDKSDEDLVLENKQALDEALDEVPSVNNDGTPAESLDAELFKTKAKGLIDRGIWQDFDGIDEYEWNEESYGELALTQAKWKAEEAFEEMLDQTGDYGKVIFGHIKNGGDPSEIITLFKESKKLEAVDISTQDSQEKILREYYTKTLKWSDTKATRTINAAIDDKSLEEEAKEVKALIDESIKEQVAGKLKEQEEFIKQQRKAVEQFENNIKSALKERKDLAEKERKEVESSLLTYDQKLPDGRMVNKFTLDFMKLQADPQRYVDLVRFVKNPEKYIQKISKEEESKAAKKTWQFIKGNGAIKTEGTGTSHPRDKGNNKQADLKIDYKNLNIN